jgi:hypothetical protein
MFKRRGDKPYHDQDAAVGKETENMVQASDECQMD